MACSNLNVNTQPILLAYREGWLVELFHRDLKSYLGLEDAGVRKFGSLHAHVHLGVLRFQSSQGNDPRWDGYRRPNSY